MSKRPTEQTPLLGKAYNVAVAVAADADADVERGKSDLGGTTTTQVRVTAGAGDQVDDGGGNPVTGTGTGSGSGTDSDNDGEGGSEGGSGRTKAKTMTTPIPWRQLLTLCLVRLVDPICFSQIFPYINDMLLDMRIVGPNEPERVGFYSGLIESTFSIAVALAIYPWARLSGTLPSSCS